MTLRTSHAVGPLTTATWQALVAAGLDPDDVVEVICRSANEDLGDAGDLTSLATVDEAAVMTARYVARHDGVLAGVPVLVAVVDSLLGDSAVLRSHRADGDALCAGDDIATITGNARGILAVERLSLNLLGHLSGVATMTRLWVDTVAGTGARIRDTRKTTPGLRDLEKYAVRCGGGVNHRRGLDSGVLVKDNHVAAAHGVAAALRQVVAAYPDPSFAVQVEVDDLPQLDEAIAGGAPEILLDNFSVEQLGFAVARTRAAATGVVLEASGGLRLDNAVAVASTGVDYLAVGALTHSAPCLDIGLDVVTPSIS